MLCHGGRSGRCYAGNLVLLSSALPCALCETRVCACCSEVSSKSSFLFMLNALPPATDTLLSQSPAVQAHKAQVSALQSKTAALLLHSSQASGIDAEAMNESLQQQVGYQGAKAGT